MSRHLWISVAVICVCSPISGAIGQPAPEGGGLRVPSGKSVQSVRQAGKADFIGLVDETGGATPKVANGDPANPNDWPATMISQPSGCTATIVGPRVVLTAAHCVANGQEVMMYIAKRTRRAVCDHHPNYSATYDTSQTLDNWDKTSADYAVCLVASEDEVTDALPFEVVGAGGGVTTGTKVRLLGFGCSGTTVNSAGYGVLRTGEARIIAIPGAARPQNNYIKTDWSLGEFGHAVGGALCPGDSGGSVYWPSNLAGQRRIVGINSRTETMGDQAQTLSGKSYLASTLTPSASSFFLTWATGKGVGICGINAGVAGCRQ